MTDTLVDTRRNARVVAVSGALLGVAAALVPHGLVFRANRIVSGTPESLAAAFDIWGAVLLAVFALAALTALSPIPLRLRGVLVTSLGGAAAVLSLWGMGTAAQRYAASAGEVARTSLGFGAWLCLLAAYLIVFAATAWMDAGVARTALTYAPLLGGVLLTAMGRLDSLAIMREYANNATEFGMQFRLHLFYVAGAVLVGLLAGVVLGLVATNGPRAEAAVFGVLNILQVWPTLAFVGLMYPVLSAAAESIPLLDALGVKGVGWAPTLVVLSCYAVYPIARNVHSAVTTLDADVVDAARGAGMGRLRRLAWVELPLALPVIIAGLRIALVQTTAGAIVAGLVGGGGLGVFVFLGAGQTASDLILLGVLPIVALALFFDRGALAVQRALTTDGRNA